MIFRGRLLKTTIYFGQPMQNSTSDYITQNSTWLANIAFHLLHVTVVAANLVVMESNSCQR